MTIRWFLVLTFIPVCAWAGEAPPSAINVGSEFAASDTIGVGEEANADAKACLEKLSWQPAKFTVRLEAAQPGCGEFLVRFPSARPLGNETNDLVAMEWFAARDEAHAIRKAPAIVVVHESGSRMTVGRMLARGLSGQGMHAFLLQLPGYGARRAPERPQIDRTLLTMQQAIADVRRARDAVAVLPKIDHSVIGLQGTSLGGFVTATAAGLDHGYDRVFILLAGGNLEEVVFHGARDAAKAREKLSAAGITDEQIKEAARQVEPLRLAHRINPATTWLYSGKFDNVVPPACSLALAKTANLADGHHVIYPTDHYSGIVYLPDVVEQIRKRMLEPLETSESKASAASAP